MNENSFMKINMSAIFYYTLEKSVQTFSVEDSGNIMCNIRNMKGSA